MRFNLLFYVVRGEDFHVIKYMDPTTIPMNFNGPKAELLPSVSEVLGSIIVTSSIVYFPHQNQLFISGCILHVFCAFCFVISP